jgi:hypothetical protein
MHHDELFSNLCRNRKKKENVKRSGKIVYLSGQYGGAGFSVQDMVSQEI